MDAFETIREKVPQTELLAQLAEEAVELAHAALKLRRIYDGINPTPVPAAVAFANLKEEIADVQLLMAVLGLDQHRLCWVWISIGWNATESQRESWSGG